MTETSREDRIDEREVSHIEEVSQEASEEDHGKAFW